MRYLLLLFLIFPNFSFAKVQLPEHLPNQHNVLDLMFKDMRSYLFQVRSASQVHSMGGNCIRYIFQRAHHTGIKGKVFITCYVLKEEEGHLKEFLYFRIKGKPAGSFGFEQWGKNLKAMGMGRLMNFAPDMKMEFKRARLIIPHIEMFIEFVRTDNTIETKFNFPDRSLFLNILTVFENDSSYRLFELSCENCNNFPRLKVVTSKRENQFETQYFNDHFAGDVTPTSFNTDLKNFVYAPIAQAGVQVIEDFQKKYDWPTLR